MKTILRLTTLITCFYGHAQTDKLFKHDGNTIEVQIKEITEGVLKYSFPNETLTRSMGKNSVAKIVYSNGQEEKISDFITIENEADFEKVVILSTKDETVGLVDKGVVRGKSGGSAFQTPETQNKVSLSKIRKAAAKLNAPFVWIEETVTAGHFGQSVRRGHAYSYK